MAKKESFVVKMETKKKSSILIEYATCKTYVFSHHLVKTIYLNTNTKLALSVMQNLSPLQMNL